MTISDRLAAEPQPAPRPGPTDAEMANAYRDLESAIADMRMIALVMESVVEDAIGNRGENYITEVIRERVPGLTGQRVFILTDDQSDALDYAHHLVGDQARKLHQLYHATYERKPAAAGTKAPPSDEAPLPGRPACAS